MAGGAAEHAAAAAEAEAEADDKGKAKHKHHSHRHHHRRRNFTAEDRARLRSRRERNRERRGLPPVREGGGEQRPSLRRNVTTGMRHVESTQRMQTLIAKHKAALRREALREEREIAAIVGGLTARERRALLNPNMSANLQHRQSTMVPVPVEDTIVYHNIYYM